MLQKRNKKGQEFDPSFRACCQSHSKQITVASQLWAGYQELIIANNATAKRASFLSIASKMHNHITKGFLRPRRFWSVLGFAIVIVFCLRFHPVNSGKPFSDEDDEEIYSNNLNFGKGSENADYQQNQNDEYVPEFFKGIANNPSAMGMIKNFRSQASMPDKVGDCWEDAFRLLSSSCGKIMKNDALKCRAAWRMTECVGMMHGRPLPVCPTSVGIANCVHKLDDADHKAYLLHLIQCNAICHHLQSDAFERDTEKVINEVISSANWAEKELDEIGKRSESLLQNSAAVAEKITYVISKSDAIFERSGETMEEQSKLREEQTRVAITMLTQLGSIQAKADDIGDRVDASLEQQKQLLDGQNLALQGLGSIQTRADIIGNAVDNIDSSVVSSLNLQKQLFDAQRHAVHVLEGIDTQADDIGIAVDSQLKQQQQLLDGQDVALQGMGDIETKATNIDNQMTEQLKLERQHLEDQKLALRMLERLKQAQAEAFEESKSYVHKISKDVHHNQLEVMSYQEELLDSHNRLAQSSNALFLAQEAFQSKQNTMLMDLDKLSSLYNSVLLESHTIKAFIFYMAMISVIYMLTNTKQTFKIRAFLYFGLCISFAIEYFILGNIMSEQALITSKTFCVRTTYMVLALVYIIFTLIQYRDYELLTYKLLVELDERMKSIESNVVGNSSLHHKDAKLLSTNQKYEQELLSRSTAQEPLTPHGRRPNQGELRNSSTISWLDADLADMDSSDDPDYVPSDSDSSSTSLF